ncbi:hypothetical protein [uncultured Algibacter sp.]|uniref:hypothetical protein n=1 Tax=uncultured Algibacter sp. TaxID=298659 RepID=UPI002614838A|nr:hypothetical protein [uncultured Algibacter sp.]
MENFIKYIGLYSTATVAIAGMIGYLTKRIIEQILNKDLEKFKTELEAQNQIAKLNFDKEMESYKSDLNLLSSRQSLLHEKRSEIILELYQKLVSLHNSMLDMTARMRNVTGKDQATIQKEELERITKTGELGNDFFNYYQTNKIFFTANICELIEEIQNGLRESHSDYSFKHLWGLPHSEMTHDMAIKANEKVKDEIPKLMSKLENEFRKSIGVIEESKK